VGCWRHGLEGMDMRACRVTMYRLEWCGTPGGRPVSESAPWSRWSGRRQSSVSFSASSSVSPTPHVPFATVARVNVRESFHEYMTR
jgi:hypothetical protein